MLERYLKISYNDVDSAFSLLKSGLEMRSKAPYLFMDRDVMSSDVQTACSTLLVLEKLSLFVFAGVNHDEKERLYY